MRIDRVPKRQLDAYAKTPSGSPIRKARSRKPELALHAHVGNMLMWMRNARMLKCVCFPVPNQLSGLISPKQAAIIKGQHQLWPGVSDWFFAWSIEEDLGRAQERWSRGQARIATCGAIELKTDVGRQNDEQTKFERWCRDMGVPYEIARSIDDVVTILVSWGRLPPDAIDRIRGKV